MDSMKSDTLGGTFGEDNKTQTLDSENSPPSFKEMPQGSQGQMKLQDDLGESPRVDEDGMTKMYA